jgi:hypothetical protein
MAKIVDGQVQFLPGAAPALHERDGLTVVSFAADLEARIGKPRPTGPPDESVMAAN